MTFRERGVYRMPNGRELVVWCKNGNDHVSFRLISSQNCEPMRYEVNDAGRLLCQGKLTAWNIEDLKDTGRTAKSLNDGVEHH